MSSRELRVHAFHLLTPSDPGACVSAGGKQVGDGLL